MRVFIKLILFLVVLSFSAVSANQTTEDASSVRIIVRDPAPLPVNYHPNLSIISIRKFDDVSKIVTNDFEIEYIANGGADDWGESCIAFPEEAKAVFVRATEIWTAHIVTSVPIKIRACWASFVGNTLGYSGASSKANFTNAPVADTEYNYSLANSLAGQDLNTSKADMGLTFNNNSNWYFGIDGNTPSNKSDFLSVALHEIAHSLNFSGGMTYDAGTGSYTSGIYNFPNIWDRYIVDGNNIPLLNTPNNSVELGNKLVSGNLYFNSIKANAANAGNKVKIYTPSPWESGSSYSHMDYNTFNNTVNSMMVPSISDGEANHNPGAIVLAMLEDMGWTVETLDVPCSYSINPQENSINTNEESKMVTVSSSPVNCDSGSWTASENLDWVSLSGDTQGSGSGNWDLAYTVSANNTGRIGSIKIGQNSHKINQAGFVLVHDERTGLYWQDEEYTTAEETAYQDGQTNVGKVRLWDSALSYCKNLDYGGYNDWYLPTKTELETIVNSSNSPTIESAFYNRVNKYFWSSTTSPTNSLHAYYINFSSASTSIGPKNYNSYIRCVRKSPFNPAVIMFLLN